MFFAEAAEAAEAQAFFFFFWFFFLGGGGGGRVVGMGVGGCRVEISNFIYGP